MKSAIAWVVFVALAAGAGTYTPEGDVEKVIDDIRISTGENISVARAETLARLSTADAAL